MRYYRIVPGIALAILLIVLTTNAFIGLIKDGGARAQGLHNAILYTGVLNIIPVIAVFLLIVSASFFAREEVLRLGVYYKIMIVWAACTCFWAPEKNIAIISFSYILAIPAASALFVKYFDGDEIYECFKFAVIFVGTMSFFWALFIPDYGIAADSEHDGLWQGVFTHKNSLGMYSVIAIAMILALKPALYKDIYGIGAIGLHFILLIKSGSSTSMLAAALMCFTYIFTNIFSNVRDSSVVHQRLVSGFVVVLTIITLLITLVYLDPSYYPLVPDSILSRVYIWSYGWGLFSESTIGGLGVNQYAYLNERGFSDMEAILGYSVGSSHNASLETLVSYGAVGLVFYIVMMAGLSKLMVYRIGFGGAIVFLSVFMVLGVTESVNFGYNFPFFILTMLSLLNSRKGG